MDNELPVTIGHSTAPTATHTSAHSPTKPTPNLLASPTSSSASNKLSIAESPLHGTPSPQRLLRNSLFTSVEAASAQLRSPQLSSPLLPSGGRLLLQTHAKSTQEATSSDNIKEAPATAPSRAPILKQATIMTKAEKLKLKGDDPNDDSITPHEMTMGVKPSTGIRFSLPSQKRKKLAEQEADSGVFLFGSRRSDIPISMQGGHGNDTIDDSFAEPTPDVNNGPVQFQDDIQGLIERHKQSISTKQPTTASSNATSSDVETGDEQDVEDLVLSEPGKLPIVRVPDVVNAKLFSYQREGIRFFYNLYVANRGGILADDMGLGKTIQTICFVMAIKAAQPATSFFSSLMASNSGADERLSSEIYQPIANGPILVVSPASLLQHWHREFYQWTRLRTFIAHGKHDKMKALEDAKANRLDVVLISYETLASSVKHLNETSFSCIIFDEAHRVKNLKTKTYLACSALKVKRKYGLTGTVMQNSFEELWTLCHVLGFATSSLGDLDYFKKNYISPIKEGHVQDASNAQISRASIVASSLAEKLSRFILRRTKQCIAHQLPPKEDHIVFCPPTDLQLKVYKRITDSTLYRLLRQNSIPCNCGSGVAAVRCCAKRPKSHELGSLFDMPKVALPALTRLQQLANHVSLIVPLQLIQEIQNVALLRRRSTTAFSSAVPPPTTPSSAQDSPTTTSDPVLTKKTSFGVDRGTQSHLITNFFDPDHPEGPSSSNKPKKSSSAATAPTKSLRPSFPIINSNETSKLPSSSSSGGDKPLSALVTSPFLKMAFGEDIERIVECLANGDDELELCGKLKVLSSLLPRWRAQDAKVLLFSSSTRVMDILAKFCTKRGFTFGRLEGTTPIYQRQRLVDQFNKTKSQFIFIVSTKACGVGLNLSSANIVVIFEPHFNVSLDMQASDRAHRIGQVRTTRVYRLVSAFTIEELTYRRQIYKQQMANIATEGRNEKRFFKMSEVFGAHLLFSLLDRSQLNTLDILERENTFAPPKDGVAKLTSDPTEPSSTLPAGSTTSKSDPTCGPSRNMDKTEISELQDEEETADLNLGSGGNFFVTRDDTCSISNNGNPSSDAQSHSNAIFQLLINKAQQQPDDLMAGVLDEGSEPAPFASTSAHSNSSGTNEQKLDGVEGALDQSELEDMDEILRKAGALHSHLNSELFSPATAQTTPSSSTSVSFDDPQSSTPNTINNTAPSGFSHSSTKHATMTTFEPLAPMNWLRPTTSMAEDMVHLSPAFMGDASCRKSSSEDEFPELM